MDLTDNKKSLQPSTIIPFPVKNKQPQLSIKIDNAETGLFTKEYISMVYRRCKKLLGNHEDAEDITQDIFGNIQEQIIKGKTEIVSPEKYLNRTATFMSINKKKRARREFNAMYNLATKTGINWFKNNFEENKETWEIGIIDNGYSQIEAEIIVKAILEEQDEKTCEIYTYKYRDNMTLKEIAELVDLSQTAVHKRIKKLEDQVKALIGVKDK